MKKPFLYLIFLSLLACNKPDKDFLQFVYSDMEKSNRAFEELSENHYKGLKNYLEESPCEYSEEIEILDSVDLKFRQQINDINYLINYFGANKTKDTFIFQKRKVKEEDNILLQKLNKDLLQTIEYLKLKAEYQVQDIELYDSIFSYIKNPYSKNSQLEILNYLFNIKIQLLNILKEYYTYFNAGCYNDSRLQALAIAEKKCIKKGDTLKMRYFLGEYFVAKQDIIFRNKYYMSYSYGTELISTSKEKGPHSDKGYIIIKEGKYQGDIIPFKIDYYVQ